MRDFFTVRTADRETEQYNLTLIRASAHRVPASPPGGAKQQSATSVTFNLQVTQSLTSALTLSRPLTHPLCGRRCVSLGMGVGKVMKYSRSSSMVVLVVPPARGEGGGCGGEGRLPLCVSSVCYDPGGM